MRLNVRLGLLMTCLVAVGLILPASAAIRDSVVNEVRIDDDGVMVGEQHRDYGYGRSDRRGAEIIGEDMIRFADNIVIEEDEIVEGDVVAILGDVVVYGVIEGDVVAVGGSVTVGPRGEVDGDAVAVGGQLHKEPGGIVHGETVSVGTGPGVRVHPKWVGGNVFSRVGRFFLFILWTAFLVLLGAIVIAVARRPVRNMCTLARREAFKMGLIGLLSWVIIFVAIAFFTVTIIGIPIGLILIPLITALAVLFGYVAVALAVGERFGNGGGRSIYTTMGIGILLLQALAILGGLLRLPGGGIGIIGAIISVFGWAVIFVAATVGLGAVVMSKFGTKGPNDKKAVPEVTLDMGPTSLGSGTAAG
jgi:hypothetical protein